MEGYCLSLKTQNSHIGRRAQQAVLLTLTSKECKEFCFELKDNQIPCTWCDPKNSRKSYTLCISVYHLFKRPPKPNGLAIGIKDNWFGYVLKFKRKRTPLLGSFVYHNKIDPLERGFNLNMDLVCHIEKLAVSN